MLRQHLHAAHHRVGDVDRVLARLLGDGDGHGRIFAAVLARDARARHSGWPAAGRRGSWPRPAGRSACRRARRPPVRRHRAASLRNGPDSTATARLADSNSPTGKPRLADCSAARRSVTVTPVPAIRAGSISTSTARPGPPIVLTSRVPATRFRSALDAVRDAFQVVGADRGVLAEKRERNDRHVVDALGLDQRAQDAQAPGQPVGIGVDRVVQPHQRLGARHRPP